MCFFLFPFIFIFNPKGVARRVASPCGRKRDGDYREQAAAYVQVGTVVHSDRPSLQTILLLHFLFYFYHFILFSSFNCFQSSTGQMKGEETRVLDERTVIVFGIIDASVYHFVNSIARFDDVITPGRL